MRFPVGDWLRKIVNPKSWLGKILGVTKGHSVSVGGHDIGLSEGHGPGISKPGESRFDRTPSRPRPSIRPGR